MEETSSRSSVFTLLTLLVIIMITLIGARVYWFGSYPVFTDEDQIEESIESEFGYFSQFP